MENPRSILAYAEGRDTREQILKIFAPYLIKSDLWFHILNFISPKRSLTPKNIGEGLKGPQRQFWKEYLFVQYEKNKNFSLILDLIPIKYVPEGTKFLRSLIAPSIKEGYFYDAWKFVARHFEMGVLRFKVLILINPTVQWHVLTP